MKKKWVVGSWRYFLRAGFCDYFLPLYFMRIGGIEAESNGTAIADGSLEWLGGA
jgi:hypothetical protein